MVNLREAISPEEVLTVDEGEANTDPLQSDGSFAAASWDLSNSTDGAGDEAYGSKEVVQTCIRYPKAPRARRQLFPGNDRLAVAGGT